MDSISVFDSLVEFEAINRLKWEYEIQRTGNCNLIGFGTADMDFLSPEPIRSAICQAARVGHLGYQGETDRYYDSIANWMMKLSGWQIDAKRTVSTNASIYSAAWAAIDAFTEPGDEIVIQTPVHFCFNEMIRDNGRITVMNPLRIASDRYEMDFENLEKCITQKTKMLWLCNPHNPVGRAWEKNELERLSDICLRHDLIIMSDDVYCALTYPGYQYTPIAMLSPEVSRNTIILNSPSKTFNVTGLKHAFVITENPVLLEKYNKSRRKIGLDYGINIVGVAATIAALNQCDNWVAGLMQHIQHNYDLLNSILSESMPQIKMTRPDSTYFAWLDFNFLPLSANERKELFEKEAEVIVAMGDVLGKGGEGYVRLNLACRSELIGKVAKRITDACRAYMD